MISIIVPVYNGCKYIDNLIERFEQQSFKDFEVIFIDDGSTDGSAERIMAASCRCLFPLRVYKQVNAGVSAARNKGLSLALGDYVCFVDADDLIHEHYLAWLYKAAQETGCYAVLGHITRESSKWNTPSKNIGSRIYNKLDFLREYLYHGKLYSICASMIKTAVLKECGLTFKEGYRYSEDVHLLWRLFARLDTVAVIEYPIYFYTDNPDSVMQVMNNDRQDAIELMTELEGYMLKYTREFSSEFIKYAVARHHWSILWQAARNFPTFTAFNNYIYQFQMKENLKKLLHYPDIRISASAWLFCKAPRMYYSFVRVLLNFK